MASEVFVRVAAPQTIIIFTLKQIFEKSWEYGKNLFASSVDLAKAYDRVPRDKLLMVLPEDSVDRQLLRTIKSFYCRLEICVCVNGKHLSNQSHSMWGLDSGKSAFHHLSF